MFDRRADPSVRACDIGVPQVFAEEERVDRSACVMGTALLPHLLCIGGGYYNLERRKASGFKSIWQRSMKKVLDTTKLVERFTEHDLRAKVGSDVESDIDAQKLLAHANSATTKKHYRRKGTIVSPAGGLTLKD